MNHRIVTIAERPDLVPLVAGWLFEAFWRRGGFSLAETTAFVAGAVAVVGSPQCFVLLVDEVPVGTAGLVADDLDERPDLTPWLAGVFVAQEARGRGHVNHLIAAVEAAARAASVTTLWLYTTTAERVYLRAGWVTIEHFEHNGRPAALMRRDLG
jgi:GNAT superfamily N-acetyltransferase